MHGRRVNQFRVWLEQNGHPRSHVVLDIAHTFFHCTKRGYCANDIYEIYRIHGRRRCFASIYKAITLLRESGAIRLVVRDRRGTHYWRYR